MEIYQKRNENILSKFPLDGTFKLIYTRDDVKEIKPFPEVFLKAMDKLNLKKEECLVFEDSLVGAEAAKKAGIDLAVMYDRYSDSDRGAINRLADYTFNDFSGVINAIDKEI